MKVEYSFYTGFTKGSEGKYSTNFSSIYEEWVLFSGTSTSTSATPDESLSALQRGVRH